MNRDDVGDRLLFWCVVLTLLVVLFACWYDASHTAPVLRREQEVDVEGGRRVVVVYYTYPWYYPWGWGYQPYPYFGYGSYHSYHTVEHHYHEHTYYHGSPRGVAARAPARLPAGGVYQGKSAPSGAWKGLKGGRVSSFKGSRVRFRR